MKICSCGYMNPDENRFCTICGKSLEENTQQPQNNVAQNDFGNNASANGNNANPKAYDNCNGYNDGFNQNNGYNSNGCNADYVHDGTGYNPNYNPNDYNQNNGSYNNGNTSYNPNHNSNGYNAGYPNAQATGYTAGSQNTDYNASNQNTDYNADGYSPNAQNTGYNPSGYNPNAQNTYNPNVEYNSTGYNPNMSYNPNAVGYNQNAAYNPNPYNSGAYTGYVPYRFSPEPVHNDKAAVLYRNTMASAVKSPLTLIAGILLIISGIFSFMALSMPLPIILGIGILVLRKANAGNPQSTNAGTTWIKVHNIINLVFMVIVIFASVLLISMFSAVYNTPEALKELPESFFTAMKYTCGFFRCITINSLASAVTSIIGLSVMKNLKNAFNYGRKRCKKLNVYAIACFIVALISIIVLIVCLSSFEGFFNAIEQYSEDAGDGEAEAYSMNFAIIAVLPVVTYAVAFVLFGLSLLKVQRANDNFIAPSDEYNSNGINTADGNITGYAHDNAFAANNEKTSDEI